MLGLSDRVQKVVQIGDADGPGTVESEVAEFVWANGHGYVLYRPRVGDSMAFFDERGRYLRSLGSKGEGPGEFTGIQHVALTEKGDVVALDGRYRWIEYSADGHLVGDVRNPGPLGSFHLDPGGTTALVAGRQGTPEAVGYTLHRVDLRSGETVSRFGARTPARWRSGEPWGDQILLGKTERNDSTVWWGEMGRPHVEEWSLDGEYRRTVTGSLRWFAPMPNSPQPGAPWTPMTDFLVDALDRLWMVTMVPDSGWRQVRPSPEGSIPRSMRDRYWDSRLDVFDLREGRHLAQHTWDSPDLKLIKANGGVLAYLCEYPDGASPAMVVYEMTVGNPQ